MTKAKQVTPPVSFIDEYCALYQDLFPDVRSFEHFKPLQMGMLSEIKRKTLPAIARTVGFASAGIGREVIHFVHR